MTTSDKATFTLNPGFFEQLYKDPAFKEMIREQAERAVDFMKADWPDAIGDELTEDSENFSHSGEHEKVFEIHETESSDGRPAMLVSVHHPYAAEYQARTGGFTKAIQAAGFAINDPD